MKKVVFTLPCAGGSSYNYSRWKLDGDVQLINVEYPGHWTRWEEKLPFDYISLLDDIERQILDYVCLYGNLDIYICGHSMGALLACLLSQKSGVKEWIKGIIVIAMVAPSKAIELEFENLTDIADINFFLSENRRVPDKILKSDFFVENMLEPIISDFRIFNKMVNEYGNFKKLNVPCLVMYSEEDPLIKSKDIGAWGEYFDNIKYSKFSGNHFFLFKSHYIPKVCSEINEFIKRDN